MARRYLTSLLLPGNATAALEASVLQQHLYGGYPPQTITDAATLAINATLGGFFRGTITANRTLGVPSGGVDGQRILVRIAPGAAARTLTTTGYTLITGITTPIPIPANKTWWGGLLNDNGTWWIISSAVQV